MVEITIDGKKVEVREGSMVMDAADQLGTYIPHFCYHKKLSIAANCRMCLVDVEKAPKPLPACATPVTPGMVVHTKSEKAVKAQQGVMEFLLINHPLDCPICDQGGECQLQDLAVGYGASASRYTEEKRVVFHKDAGPLISMEEMSRCIHCTRCVRFGQEIAGVMEFGMLGRGEHSEITTFVGRAVDSELSGNMIDICPVGALTSRPFRYAARTWELSRRKSISPHDGLGANLIVQVKNNKVMRVVPLENEAINECWISDKDRFSYEALHSAERLTKPMIKQGGQWHETDWESALQYVVETLLDIRSQHGAVALGALASPYATLEELHLLQKLMRGLGSENIDSRLRQTDFSLDGQNDAAPWLGMDIAEFAKLDRALVVGSFLRKDHPLLTQRLRQSAKRRGEINILHAADDELLMPIANKLIAAPSAWPIALAEIAAAVAAAKGEAAPAPVDAIGETAKSIAASLQSGSSKAVLLGNAAVQHPDYAQLLALANWIATATGAKIGILTEAANTVGAWLAKAVPGGRGLNVQAMLKEPRRAYVLLHAEPEFDCANPALAVRTLRKADSVIMLSAFKTGLDHADVLLPIAPFTETSGTFVNCEGRAQSFNGVVRPVGEARPGWKVLRVLGNLLNLPGFDYDTSEAVRDEVTSGQTDLSGRCAIPRPDIAAHIAPGAKALERIADVPIHFADPIVRRAPALQKTADARAPAARMNSHTLSRLGLLEGDTVRVTQDDGSEAVLPCKLDERVAEGCVRIAAAHPLTAGLGSMFGTLKIEKFAGAV